MPPFFFFHPAGFITVSHTLTFFCPYRTVLTQCSQKPANPSITTMPKVFGYLNTSRLSPDDYLSSARGFGREGFSMVYCHRLGMLKGKITETQGGEAAWEMLREQEWSHESFICIYQKEGSSAVISEAVMPLLKRGLECGAVLVTVFECER